MELPKVLQDLPGAQDIQRVEAAKEIAQMQIQEQVAQQRTQEIAYEGAKANLNSDQRQQFMQQDFQQDMQKNDNVAQELKQVGMPADARGVAGIAAAANRFPDLFRTLVHTAQNVALSLGQNPTASDQFERAKDAFFTGAHISPIQTGDVQYLVFRIIEGTRDVDATFVREQLQQQVDNNADLIASLKKSGDQHDTAKAKELERANGELRSIMAQGTGAIAANKPQLTWFTKKPDEERF